MASRLQVKDFLENVKKLYPRFNLNQAVEDLWVEEFGLCPAHALCEALRRYVQNQSGTPELCDLRNIALSVLGGRFGSRHIAFTDFDEIRRYRYARGLVDTWRKDDEGHWLCIWEPKDTRAVFRDGKWQQKIEYAMDKLGPKKVEHILRSELKLSEMGVVKSLVANKFPVAKYKQLLEQVVQMADSAAGGV